MSARTCPCARPVTDGYLCHRCAAVLHNTIASSPEWADQLGLVLARLTRYSDPTDRKNAEAPLPYNPAASEPARRLDATLRAAAGAYGAPSDVRTERLGYVAAWLAGNVEAIRVSPEAVYWERRITAAVEHAVAVCDRPPEQWYAGACAECKRDLYPLVTDHVVVCPCGQTWPVQTRRDQLLAAVANVDAPGPVIARALTAFGNEPITPERLRKWRHKGDLVVRRMTTHPATNWYRVGDVLALVAKEEERRRRRKR